MYLIMIRNSFKFNYLPKSHKVNPVSFQETISITLWQRDNKHRNKNLHMYSVNKDRFDDHSLHVYCRTLTTVRFGLILI